MSKTEKAMLDYLAPWGVQFSQSFEPYYQAKFADREGYIFTARPDAAFHIADEPEEPLFLEIKSCMLNAKKSYSTAKNGLLGQYNRRFYPATGEHLSHDQLSSALWPKWRNDCLNQAWNHSKHKHAIVSRALPIGKYIVIFPDAIFFKDDMGTVKAFKEYTNLGIQCMALSEVPAFLSSL